MLLRAAAVVLLATACSAGVTPRAALTPSPEPASPSATGTPRPSPSGPMDEFTGGQVHLRLDDGQLWVSVVRTRQADGTVETTVRYQREGVIDYDAVPVLWEVEGTVPDESFVVAEDLSSATFTATLRDQPIRITWAASAEPRRQVNMNGSFLIETRDAASEVEWGEHRQSLSGTEQVPAQLYYRLTPPPD